MKNIYLTAVLLFSLLYTSSVGQQLNITQLGYLPYQLTPGSRISNIGGYVDSQGNEYALMGHPDGLAIIDVTDPVNPFQLFMVPTPAPGVGNANNWREVKTMGNYAYVVSEAGGGLQIVNLTDLPTNYQQKTWTGDGAINGQLNKSHALHVDDNHVYIYGPTGVANRGIIIANISDPWNPTYVGMYNLEYVHDGYVRADTVYAAQIYKGTIAIIDVSNKANPQLVNTIATPTAFPHNTWLSDDSKTLFTTDENAGSFLASFDVSDKQNITELDRIQSFASDSSIVHNTHIINDFAVTSWYTDGVTIVDAARPANLIETGYFDFPPISGPNTNGVWGVFPYLPSGNLVVSHRDSGLYILGPTYIRGAYLEGIVTDSITGLPLANAKVEILTTNGNDISKISGEYKTGTASPGNYDIRISRTGYHDKIISNINLDNGILTLLDVELMPTIISVNENIIEKGIIIYPNPAKEIINVSFNDAKVKEIRLTDLAGKNFFNQLYSNNIRNLTINTTNLSAGFYLLVAATDKGVVTAKVVIVNE